MFRLRSLSGALALLAILAASPATAGQLTLSPSSVEFGEVPVGQQSSKTMIITNHGSATTITGLASVGGCGEFQFTGAIPVTLQDLDTLTVEVTYTPTNRGPDICTMEIVSDNGVGDFIGATGVGLASSLFFYDTLLTFSTQPWDTAVPETLYAYVGNLGNASIEASNLSVTMESGGSDFEIGPVVTPVLPGEVIEIPVYFHPQSPGQKIDHVILAVNNNPPTEPEFPIRVEGGWYLDTGVEHGPSPIQAIRIRPTPSRGNLGVTLSAPRAGTLAIDVLDLAGRAVARRSEFVGQTGPHTFTLRRNSDWSPAPGVYLVRATLDGSLVGLGRVVVVR